MNKKDILEDILYEYECARRLKQLNQGLYDHLTGSLYYLIKYCEKNNLPLPNKDILLGMVKNASFIIDQFAKPTTYQQPDKTPSDSTKS